ncbi:MAG: hypothetical protein M3Y87_32210, partial [Myxococcota bacterium]|nr:hypothetical protein [Myxococcota bacterium]
MLEHRSRVTALVALSSVLLALPCARAAAQQIVVTDVTYEHSATTTSDSHYRLEPLPGTPANLRSPIDYASGEAYVRLEVLTKPSDAGTRFQVCFEARPTYACTDQAPAYTTTGLYTWATPFSRFYQGSMVDWTMGLGRVALILKDTMNRKPSPENVGEETSRLYMPTRIRVTVTLVPPGGTYVPPADPELDAGMMMIDDAGTTELDAALMPELDASATELDAAATDAGTARTDATVRRDAGAPRETVTGGCS